MTALEGVDVETGEVIDNEEFERLQRLKQLKTEIVECNTQALGFLSQAFDYAVYTGERLLEAKALCVHGEFLPFVSTCEISAPTAQRYMRIAENKDFLNASHVTHLSIREADKALRKVRQDSETIEPEPLTHEELAALDEKIFCCDFRSLDLADSSVDAIVTDPPYPAEFLPLFNELAHFAAGALKDGGLLAMMVGQSYLPYILKTFTDQDSPPELNYLWTLAYVTPGGQSAQLWTRKVNTFWKPILLFAKGEYDGSWLGDVVKSDVNDNDKTHHYWGQSESGMRDLLRRVSKEGELVCDPFLGGGTTAVVARSMNRAFVGCDIDQSCVDTTNRRLSEISE